MPQHCREIILTEEQQKLVADNIKLAHWSAQKVKNLPITKYMRMDYDDCLSLFFEALCRTASWYEPERAAFSTAYAMYAKQIFERKIRSALQQRYAEYYKTLSYDCPIEGRGKNPVMLADILETDEPDVSVMIEEKAEIARILRALEVLPEEEKRAFTGYVILGKNIRQIANENGVSKQTIMKRKRVAAEKIRLRLKAEDLISSYKMRRENNT